MLSRASIWLTVTCLPTSRRNSSTEIGCVQSRLSTSSPRPRLVPTDPRVEVDDPAELLLDARHVVVEHVVVEQVALLGATARVADHARGAAGQGDRTVAGILEAAQRDEPDQVADVQAVGRRIAPVVDRRPGLRPRWARRNSRSVESWMRLRASRSAIRSNSIEAIRTGRVLSPGGPATGRFGCRTRRPARSRSRPAVRQLRLDVGPPRTAVLGPRQGRRRPNRRCSGCSSTLRRSNSSRCCCSRAPTTWSSTNRAASSRSGIRTSPPTIAAPTIRSSCRRSDASSRHGRRS